MMILLLAFQGRLVAIGGGDIGEEITKAMVAKGPKRVAIVTTASGEPDVSARHARERFEAAGCKEVVVGSDAATLKDADLIYFTGGDQNRLMKALSAEAVAAVREAYEAGATIAGTSAGAAAMSDPMITGEGDFETLKGGAVESAKGLGLSTGFILDQHHVKRRRTNRLLTLVLENPKLVGLGVDEATAVVVEGGKVTVVGEGCVLVLDGRKAKASVEKGKALSATGVALHVLRAGDTFDLGDK